MTKLALNQVNFTVGALAKNTEKLISYYKKSANKVDLSIFPELGIAGYPPEDLLLSDSFLKKVAEYQGEIIAETKKNNSAILFGAITKEMGKLYNVAYFAQNGVLEQIIYKNSLPNYGVFDEKRYFDVKNQYQVITLKETRFLILICEDLWQDDLLIKLKNLRYDEVIILNASPYNTGKLKSRIALTTLLSKKCYYLNSVGGQDSLVFDGNSFILDNKGVLLDLLPSFEEVQILSKETKKPIILPESLAQDYNALTLGLADYVKKNNFSKVAIGLSGGADSALVAAIACDALGSDKVNLVTMPSKYTSAESFKDAESLLKQLNCNNHKQINIEEINSSFLTNLAPHFNNKAVDLTEENLQARIRGTLLMSLANKFGYLVLATSNKSESAVGYATLYGDMCGAYSVIKDVYKTKVYELIKWRNEHIPKLSLNPVKAPIDSNIITKAPTAELRDNQLDTDSLPDYEILDQILHHLIEEKKSIADIIAYGFNQEIVTRIYNLLKNSEYKRFQAAVGPKISELSFDKERRMPLTNNYENS